MRGPLQDGMCQLAHCDWPDNRLPVLSARQKRFNPCGVAGERLARPALRVTRLLADQLPRRYPPDAR